MEIAPPQLAQRCALGGFFKRKLTIYARNGAIAAKLRQTLPSLLSKFQAKGYEVTAIRIAVQANFSDVRSSQNTRATNKPGGAGKPRSLHCGIARVAIEKCC